MHTICSVFNAVLIPVDCFSFFLSFHICGLLCSVNLSVLELNFSGS